MSEEKFTKGEWFVNYIGVSNSVFSPSAEYEVCYSKDNECVAEYVYNKSDAHLIASAPDMYEEIMRDISHLKIRINNAKCSEIKSRLSYELSRKENILAKARGENE